MQTGERGFTYLLLLFAIAAGAATLAAAAPRWQTAMQRERETELVFRAGEIAQALARYRDVTPAGRPAAPESLDELLEDRRGTRPLHHLRRLYVDPFTGQADWQLERGDNGRIVGLRTRSPVEPLRQLGVTVAEGVEGRPVRLSDWVFRPPAPTAPVAAVAPVTSR